MRRRSLLIVIASILLLIVGLVIRNQVKVYRGRQARALGPSAQQAVNAQFRQQLFDALRPVAVTNCLLERFGETNDGGYLMCANLLQDMQSAYSYGISGYDKWGCDISTAGRVTVHQYDCFNTTQPQCPTGKTVFHAECVGSETKTEDGRFFDTVASQLSRNGDEAKRVVVKMDVEGAEWMSIRSMPDEVLSRIDQMAVEFHWMQDSRQAWIHDPLYLEVVKRLRQFFDIAHIHFNNASCVGDLDPFPSWAFEVLFVNKRLAVADASQPPPGLHPLDARNNPTFADCQPRP
jgi:hypothetical protein